MSNTNSTSKPLKPLIKFKEGVIYQNPTKLYHILLIGRENGELNFKVIHKKNYETTYHYVKSYFEADDNGAYETVRLLIGRNLQTIRAYVAAK